MFCNSYFEEDFSLTLYFQQFNSRFRTWGRCSINTINTGSRYIRSVNCKIYFPWPKVSWRMQWEPRKTAMWVNVRSLRSWPRKWSNNITSTAQLLLWEVYFFETNLIIFCLPWLVATSDSWRKGPDMFFATIHRIHIPYVIAQLYTRRNSF